MPRPSACHHLAVRQHAADWIAEHPDELALIKRVWQAADDRVIPSRIRPEDKASLTDWVTDRVMNSPMPVPDWLGWPPRFVHLEPHRDLADFHPIS